MVHLGRVRALFHEIADHLVEGELPELQRTRHLSLFDRYAAQQMENADDGFRRLR
ncbi:hypothetical protein GCM10018785_08080 [Streptomyces longispororuber]|uniref:Uncharacterized protein n=1 Tax=Streptomyces longispororuber TaxID=68230 RepID=A0A919DGF5_9ACTN|nr:hypothetical protein GCM10018785_08080 [Streptomyces longispororuber]